MHNAMTEAFGLINAALDRAERNWEPRKQCWACAHYLHGMCRENYPDDPREVDADSGCEKWRAF